MYTGSLTQREKRILRGLAAAVVVLAFGACLRAADRNERAVSDCTTVALAVYASERRIPVEALPRRQLEEIVFTLQRQCADPGYRQWLADEMARQVEKGR